MPPLLGLGARSLAKAEAGVAGEAAGEDDAAGRRRGAHGGRAPGLPLSGPLRTGAAPYLAPFCQSGRDDLRVRIVNSALGERAGAPMLESCAVRCQGAGEDLVLSRAIGACIVALRRARSSRQLFIMRTMSSESARTPTVGDARQSRASSRSIARCGCSRRWPRRGRAEQRAGARAALRHQPQHGLAAARHARGARARRARRRDRALRRRLRRLPARDGGGSRRARAAAAAAARSAPRRRPARS